jgi:uncharacterized membrane-anchored protein
MKGNKKIIFIVNLVIVLGIFNWLILEKETTLKNGELVLLKIYPLDPLSLMQGKYMTLAYEMTRDWNREGENLSSSGFCIVKKETGDFAKYIRLQNNRTPLGGDEIAIKYTRGDGIVRIGAESFLFEEGQEETYESAKYAGLKVALNGSSVLMGLYNGGGEQIVNHYEVED